MNNAKKKLRYSLAAVLMIALAILATWWLRRPPAVVLFEDVTASSGISYQGMTHGAAWGDFDGDGLPDIYLTNHLADARLYRNLGNGRFADVSGSYFAPQDLGGDKHGAAWADFDNDGRLDLVQLTGAVQGAGSEPKHLFLNRGAKFEEVAETVGVSNLLGRTRMPMWYDINRDGRLDLFHGAEARFDDKTPPFAFVQRDGKFAESEILKFASRTTPFCIAAPLNDDSFPELICRISGKSRTTQIFDVATLPARELDLLPATAFEDIAAADFDNDDRIDLYLARKNPPGTVALGQPASKEIIADVWTDQANVGKPAGFSFRSSGQLTFRVVSAHPKDALSPTLIHLGSQGAHPDNLSFSVSPDTKVMTGMAVNEAGARTGVYVGFTPPDKWEVRVTAARGAFADGKAEHQQIAAKISSSAPITQLEAIGGATTPEEAPARLFMNRGGKLVEESEKRGVNARAVAASNVVAGDFDNDMDVDLFVVASGDVGKQENLLLLNRGNGRFDVVPNAGGAAGNRVGVGDSVTVADFDRNGFLDLLVATGASMGRSFGLPSEGGSYQLYRNLGNGNHWLEIDLKGTSSNRDGIGALVRVTAGGVTQMRVQDGGVHHRGQNHQRLHFGLAKHMQIDKITVHWPSGTVQELTKTAADQVLRIKEPPKPTEAASGGAK